jgi:hypothetical protein
MPENRRRHYHPRMIAALEDLQIRAAGERGLDSQADFAGFERGRRDILNLDIFPAEQDCGFHARNLQRQTGKGKTN